MSEFNEFVKKDPQKMKVEWYKLQLQNKDSNVKITLSFCVK